MNTLSGGKVSNMTLNLKHADKKNLPLGAKKCNTKQYDTFLSKFFYFVLMLETDPT